MLDLLVFVLLILFPLLFNLTSISVKLILDSVFFVFFILIL